MTEAGLINTAALFAAVGDYVRVRYPADSEGLAQVIGWADIAGRPVARDVAVYVVVVGDVSAGPGWDQPTLLRVPDGKAV